MKKYITIIAIIICGFANAQTGYLVQPAKWKFIKPQWLDSGMWIKNIPKYGGQNRILVYDSITNKVGYKYISNGATYTAGRGLTLNSNVFRLDTTLGFTWTNAKTIFNATPISTPNYGLINFGNGGFSGGANHFTGSANGTVLAMNMASGYGGDLTNLQIGGVSKFSVDKDGDIVANGITGAAGLYDFTGYNIKVQRISFNNQGYIRGTGVSSMDFVNQSETAYASVTLGGTFAPSSGSTAFNAFTVSSAHNATGAASGAYKPVNITYTINNTGTASTATATGLFLNATETALNGMTHNLMDLQVGGTSKFKVDNIGNVTAKNGKLTGVLFTQTATATVANTTTETTLVSTGTGSVTLPADFFEVGKSIVIHAEGYHSATSNPVITVKIKLGGTTYMTTGTVTSGNSTDAYCEIKGTITCRTTGASGTVFAQGFYLETETGGANSHFGMPNTTTQTIDTTTTQAVDVTVQWGTASASNTISITNLIIEAKN